MEIYLDNAATTKPCPAAVAAVMEALTENWGNPSAVHQLGLRAEKAVKQARQQVAAVLGCSPDQLFFTSGGTEGDNFAVFSVAQRYHKRGRHIITTAVEHHAVLRPIQALEAPPLPSSAAGLLIGNGDGTVGCPLSRQKLQIVVGGIHAVQYDHMLPKRMIPQQLQNALLFQRFRLRRKSVAQPGRRLDLIASLPKLCNLLPHCRPCDPQPLAHGLPGDISFPRLHQQR